MSDRRDIIDLLEHGDVLIRKADNGYTINYLQDGASKTYDGEDECYGNLNPNALITEVIEVQPHIFEKEEQNRFKTLIYSIINAMGVYFSKHNKYQLDIIVEERKDE